LRRTAVTALALAGALALPAAAAAQTYPEPKDPGKIAPKPKGPFHTLTVCKKKHRCDFRTIQKAVNQADAGDTVRVKNGVYHEAVTVDGRKKRFLKLVGNRKKPGKVVLDGDGKRQNGVFINDADEVTVEGFKARDYKANGFFVTNAVGYTFTHLQAVHAGVYGLYAFNSKGGVMSHSEAHYFSDAGFYIGQTPQQTKPIRSTVTDVTSWGNPIGFSGSNMRYVTITKSRFYNNATGIVPNSDGGEKFPPPEDDTIIDNDIFWNNFDFHKGAPFKPKKSGLVPLVPVGTGVLLAGGKHITVEGNRIYGHYLGGVGAIQSPVVDDPVAATLVGNQVTENEFGLGGEDLNARDLVTDGDGSDNCFGPNDGVRVLEPNDPSMFPNCPFAGANRFSADAHAHIFSWAGENARSGWIVSPHKPQPGLKPLEEFKK
jgi:hypothetical protein